MENELLRVAKGVAKSARRVARGLDRMCAIIADPEPVTPPPDGWIDWHGGECPVTGCADVDVELLDGYVGHAWAAETLRWSYNGGMCDIIRYRVTDMNIPPESAENGADVHEREPTCPTCGGSDVYEYEGANRGCRDCKSQWCHSEEVGTPPPSELVEALQDEGMLLVKHYADLAAAVRELSWAMVPYGDREPTDTERYKRACKTARAVEEMNG